ncbi:MAG: cation diffusion facilitator family transporter [Alphaproteobacteria bacterium]|nr:MAG: cation diffusion facilitator family transporter [Alphaproteobacteria bacterium]
MTNDRLIKLASIAAISTSLILIILKIYIWIVTQSLSVEASLFDSLLDAVTSIINFFAIIHATKPADSCHRFGHGKIESLACFTQSIFIAFSALCLLYSIIQNFIHPEPLIDTGYGFFWMIIVSILTLALILFQRHVVRKTNSQIIKTDNLHYETDLFVNAGVLLSLALSLKFQFIYLDILIGMIIVCYVLSSSFDILKSSCNVLLDRELPEEERLKVIAVVNAHKKIEKLMNLRTRSCGNHNFIELTLSFDSKLTVSQIQALSKKITQEIQEKIPGADVVIQLPH